MSIEFIQHILDLPSHQQVRYWGSWQPWSFQGKKQRLPECPIVHARDVTVDCEGHITRLTKPVLRPCFGSPTAFLLHGGKDFQHGYGGILVPSRCARCPARVGCEYVAKCRLRISTEIQGALDAWEAAGGKEVMRADRRNNVRGITSLRWADLLRAFDRHVPFRSVNDQRIRDYLNKKHDEKRQKDAKRQQQNRDRERRKSIAAGEFDDEFLANVRRHTIHRELMFNIARREPTGHNWLDRCPPDGASFTARVWHAKILLNARRAKDNASSIATELLTRRLVDAVDHGVLRDRVSRALPRIEKLEKTTLPGWSTPVWEKISIDDLVAPAVVLG